MLSSKNSTSGLSNWGYFSIGLYSLPSLDGLTWTPTLLADINLAPSLDVSTVGYTELLMAPKRAFPFVLPLPLGTFCDRALPVGQLFPPPSVQNILL